MLLRFKCLHKLDAIMCSIALHNMHVSDITPTNHRVWDSMCPTWQTDTPRPLYGKKNSPKTSGV